MGRISVACYRPKAGCELALLELVRNHMVPLLAEGLVTDRVPIVGMAGDGTIVEVFEWKSVEAIEAAHQNLAVHALWAKFGELCECVSPASLPDLQGTFGGLEAV